MPSSSGSSASRWPLSSATVAQGSEHQRWFDSRQRTFDKRVVLAPRRVSKRQRPELRGRVHQAEAVRLGVAAGRRLDRLRERHTAVESRRWSAGRLGVDDEPRRELHEGRAATSGLEGGQVAWRVQVVVVKVRDQLGRVSSRCGRVALRSDRDCALVGGAHMDVSQPRVRNAQEEGRWRRTALHHDQPLVGPRLRREARPQSRVIALA
eukprot:1400319-Prymnesium_polylepis.2